MAYGRFLLHLYSYSPSTQTTYKNTIKWFVDSAPKYIDQIRGEHIEQFLSAAKKTHAATTVNIYLAAIRNFFDWLEANYDVINRARRVKRLKILPPHRRNLTVEEYSRVIKVTTGYERDLIQLTAMVGVRASEILSIRQENIKGDFLAFLGKGSKQCSCPLNSIAKNILKDPNFINFLKNKNRVWFFRLCHRASKLAGLEKPFSPHKLRHFYANILHRSQNGKPGLPIETISKLMNHSTPSVTASVYIEWLNEELIGKTEKLAKLSI